MKRIKVVLTAACAVALVSGAMAFTSAKHGSFIFEPNPASGNDCTLLVTDQAIQDFNGTESANTVATPGLPCPSDATVIPSL